MSGLLHNVRELWVHADDTADEGAFKYPVLQPCETRFVKKGGQQVRA